MSVKDYNVEPELNVSISGISIAEGCAPSGINDAIRQLMADVKEESEAQARAVGEASTQLSSLDSTLRAFIAEEVAKYLPLAGGVMTDNCRICWPTTANLGTDAHDGVIRIYHDSPQNGAGLWLVANDAKENWPGSALLQVCDKSSGRYHALRLLPDGRLLKDDTENVLTSAGGEVNGSFLLSGNIVGSSRNDTLSLFAHSDASPALNLFGADFAGYSGVCELVAQNANSRNAFSVHPDGQVTTSLGGRVALYSQWANYAGAYNIGRVESFTAPGSGWLFVTGALFKEDKVHHVCVNGAEVACLRGWTGSWTGSTYQVVLPLSAGDVVTGIVPAEHEYAEIYNYFVPTR